MRRGLLAVALSVYCIATSAFAADVPYVPELKPSHAMVTKFKPHHKVATVKSSHMVAVAVLPKVMPGSISQPPKIQAKLPMAPTKLPDEPTELADDIVELPWVLDPLVALADGGKREGSASVEGNLVTDKARSEIGPEVAIELTGHVVKTAQSTIRLDIHIGSIARTVLWKADEIKSGRFKVTLNDKMAAGPMPSYFPASALAFVTQEGDGHVAMVSLEKIVFRIGKLHLAATP